MWLKMHNPLYANILISDESLDQFPEDEIPGNILDVVKYSDDTEQVDRECAGYAVEDDDVIQGGETYTVQSMCLASEILSCTDDTELPVNSSGKLSFEFGIKDVILKLHQILWKLTM